VRKISNCWLAIVMLAGVFFVAHAQSRPCEPLRPLSGTPLQYKDRGNRCEGLYDPDYGAKALALISLTFGDLNYPLAAGIKLELTVPEQTVTTHIRAVPRPSNIAYEMDALLDVGSTLSWPVDDVLLPENLNAKQVGIFAWNGNDPNKVFVPVLVRAPGSSTSRNANIILSVRPSFEAQVMKWRSAPLTNGKCDRPVKWMDVGPGSVNAGQTVDIKLAHIVGLNCIDIAAQGSGADWVPLNLQVNVPHQ
jgi:hypothetical protein